MPSAGLCIPGKIPAPVRGCPDLFFDLMTDPLEMSNLIDNLKMENEITSFQNLLKVIKSLPERDNDPRYIPNPAQPWDVDISAESQVWKQ